MALIVGGATFDRLFAGVRFDEVDGDIFVRLRQGLGGRGRNGGQFRPSHFDHCHGHSGARSYLRPGITETARSVTGSMPLAKERQMTFEEIDAGQKTFLGSKDLLRSGRISTRETVAIGGKERLRKLKLLHPTNRTKQLRLEFLTIITGRRRPTPQSAPRPRSCASRNGSSNPDRGGLCARSNASTPGMPHCKNDRHP
jgi:hypothetical protein